MKGKITKLWKTIISKRQGVHRRPLDGFAGGVPAY
jgi:hypothetical protein